MPVTKTARRALRSSERKLVTNDRIRADLEKAVRIAKRKKSLTTYNNAASLADRAAKKHVLHKNKAARIKSSLAKLLPQKAVSAKSSPKKQPKKAKK